MQLKNLYIDEAYRRRHLGTQLFSAVERFCVKRGSTAIDTEVPVEEKSTVAFLNSVGFLVHAHLDSPYRRGDLLYRMYKPLPRMYTRDPFDLTELTAWTLDVGLGFRIEKQSSDIIEFMKPVSANGYSLAVNQGTTISLTGTACVCDQATDIDSAQLKKLVAPHAKRGRSLIIVSGRRFSDGAQKTAIQNRVLCLSRKDLDNSLSSCYPFVPPTFDKEQIGGILAPIKSAYLKALDPAPNQEKTYFKGGPVGKFLKPGDTIFFYVESDTTATGAILARATIRDMRAGHPTYVWDQSATRNPVFQSRPEYETWSSDKTDVVAITYAHLERIEPLHRAELQTLRSLERLEDDQVGTFYLSVDDVAVMESKCRLQPPQRQGAGGLAVNTHEALTSLRDHLTNGELPTFSFLAPTSPKARPVDADKTRELMAATQVLIVTAAQIELETALSVLQPHDGVSVLSGYSGQAVYFFGQLGPYSVAVAKCKAGSVRRDAATLTVRQAIADCDPFAVIAVGVAFGGYTNQLKIGDVLVSEQVIPYDIQRLGATSQQFRGPIPEAGPILLNRFANARGWDFERPDGHSCRVKVGPLLSGETLLDSLDDKVRLFEEHPTAIGGEMEAVGIYAAASRHEANKEWIIVKAVCDWGDGTKKASGDAYHPLAAAASLSLVKFVLSTPEALTELSVK
jgi:nucleoside phosphorylase